MSEKGIDALKTVPFSSLAELDVCVGDISCVERKWSNKWENRYTEGRDQNVLSFTVCGHKRLYLPDRDEPIYDVLGPSAFFIARGTPYISKSSTDDTEEEGHTICIKFKLFDADGEEIRIAERHLCFSSLTGDFFLHLFRQLIGAYTEGRTNNLQLKRMLYRLLEELVNLSRTEADAAHDYKDLLPALRYIESNMSSAISVGELAQLCFMSESYFSKRFKQYTGGVCLTDYRNRLRVEKAKEFLESSLWTVNLIAETLGFYDTSHFYRVYKKYTGKSPKQYKKKEK